jgi:8-oxo-dGTP pyrophosphatase MutT (NUDIX family)
MSEGTTDDEGYNRRMRADGIVPAIHARLVRALAAPEGEYAAFRVDRHTVGWLDPARAARLSGFTSTFERAEDEIRLDPTLADCSARTAAVEKVTRALAGEGLLSAWRDERYAVAVEFGAKPLVDIERAAARYFGIRTYAVHVNGLVRSSGGVVMWLARRSPTKAIDPGLLDNLVGGGIATGFGVLDTLRKEAWEEAGIPPAVAARARPEGSIDICRPQPQGLQRETIFVYDLELDADFKPANQDGEAVEHRQLTMSDAARLIAADDGDNAVTADASLVILDCLLRHSALGPDRPDIRALSAFRHAMLEPARRKNGRGAWPGAAGSWLTRP